VRLLCGKTKKPVHYINVFPNRVIQIRADSSTFGSSILNIKSMPLLTILLVLIGVGVVLWLINNYIPMDRNIKTILNVVVIIVLIVWLLRVFGLWDSMNSLRI